jgi:hypothetical protein
MSALAGGYRTLTIIGNFLHERCGRDARASRKLISVAVGSALSDRPRHRSVRAGFPHTALPSSSDELVTIRIGMQHMCWGDP